MKEKCGFANSFCFCKREAKRRTNERDPERRAGAQYHKIGHHTNVIHCDCMAMLAHTYELAY